MQTHDFAGAEETVGFVVEIRERAAFARGCHGSVFLADYYRCASESVPGGYEASVVGEYQHRA